MKSLIFGILLIVLLGIGGIVYRFAVESVNTPVTTACTLEAKICPDGTSVGRTGTACEFAPCLPPNVEVKDIGLSFAIPPGYVADENAYGAEPTLVAAFIKPATGGVSHTIIIRRFPIPEGETAEQVILANTRFQPADMQATDMQKFGIAVLGGHTFRNVVIERFEAVVQSAYYLARSEDVLRFEIVEHDVTNWMEPTLEVSDLPEHKALLKLLETLQAP